MKAVSGGGINMYLRNRIWVFNKLKMKIGSLDAVSQKYQRLNIECG
jgi:hypothetical protein